MVDYMKYSQIGAGIGVSSWVLGQIYSFMFRVPGQIQASLNLAPIQEELKLRIQEGINTDLASQLLGNLSGALPPQIAGFFLLLASGVIVMLMGAFLVDILGRNIKALKAGGPVRKLVTVAVSGTLGAGLIVGFMSTAINPEIPAIGTTIALMIYFVIVAFVYAALARLSKGTQLKQFFIEP